MMIKNENLPILKVIECNAIGEFVVSADENVWQYRLVLSVAVMMWRDEAKATFLPATTIFRNFPLQNFTESFKLLNITP